MQKCNGNAADRYSYVGDVYGIGEQAYKKKILDSMPKEWSTLHRQCYIHIHDLDAYGLTNNCLTFDILRDFPYQDFAHQSDDDKIIGYFDYLMSLFIDIGNEQSGGMALANFDSDTACIFSKIGVQLSQQNMALIKSCIRSFIAKCNHMHTRMGKTSYYITLNIGLATDEFGRFIANSLLDIFESMGDLVYKPNIVFKVKSGVNSKDTDPNYDIYTKALLCTAKKMIPTYLLCDSEPDKDVDADKLAIMGCRTRVVDDLYGERTSIGRGNIANISINLPKLALDVDRDNSGMQVEQKIALFTQKWLDVANITKDILIDRYQKVLARKLVDFPVNSHHKLWLRDFDDVKEVFQHGTLSIGFIGLSEAFEVLTGKRFYSDQEVYNEAVSFVNYMREYCDGLTREYSINFSLLAASGELISGRFIEQDKQDFANINNIFDKCFYTNSFHINVDSKLIAFEKIQKEGIFHKYCNGGSITYVELAEAPISNSEGLMEYVQCAERAGVHYLGFNFPKDVCNECGASGVFDICPNCGSKNITRIRRVSGYLEVLDGFTYGKKNEVKARRQN